MAVIHHFYQYFYHILNYSKITSSFRLHFALWAEILADTAIFLNNLRVLIDNCAKQFHLFFFNLYIWINHKPSFQVFSAHCLYQEPTYFPAPLSSSYQKFVLHNRWYCLTIPSQATLAWSNSPWVRSAPKPAWPLQLVCRHPGEKNLSTNNQDDHDTWLPLSLTMKPAVPATILPSSDAPSWLSSRIVTGTDIIPLWKFWGFSALIRENSYKTVSDNRA